MQFMNNRKDVVNEAIDGFIATANGRLKRLDGFPHIRVVLQQDWDNSKVAVISGGGSGHEPAHIGFVARGMLAAAVCGDVFASPSSDAILAAILAVSGPAGCLLVVKNYTGDRLNFGLAAERARAAGIKVEMVIVSDDIALPGVAQPRGVAGTLFIHKIAGALAEQGESLDTIFIAAQQAATRVRTIGMSLDTCRVPGSEKEDRIPAGMAELGLGIHGEPGVEQVEFQGAREAVALMVRRLSEGGGNGPYVALLNNLGGTSSLEMSVLTTDLVRSSLGERISHFVGPASLMSAIDMRGFSISLMAADDREITLLQEPVPFSAWCELAKLGPVALAPMPDGTVIAPAAASDDPIVREVLLDICQTLVDAEQALNRLDAKSGDGDTGSTLAGAAQALSGVIDKLPLADIPALLNSVSHNLSQTMGGSSGVLLAIFFAAAAESSSSGAPLVEALLSGLTRMQEIGGARLGDRTMVDALHPALKSLAIGIGPAASAARKGANLTSTFERAKAGRAAHVGADQFIGHNDPGAEAVAIVFENIAANR